MAVKIYFFVLQRLLVRPSLLHFDQIARHFFTSKANFLLQFLVYIILFEAFQPFQIFASEIFAKKNKN
jgi:hypothetical protein